MEERQRRDGAIVGADRGARPELRHVGEKVAVGEDDSLGRALGAGGEEDSGLAVAAEPARDEAGGDEGRELVEARRRRAQILGPEHIEALHADMLDELAEAALLDEGAAREHAAAAGGAERGEERTRADGGVEHRRHPARAPEREKHGGRAGCGGQQDAHPLAGGESGAEPALEHRARKREISVGEGLARDVLEGDAPAPETAPAGEDRLGQRGEPIEGAEARLLARMLHARPSLRPQVRRKLSRPAATP